MRSRLIAVIATTSLLAAAWPTSAAGPAVGAAPKGDPSAVASRIIKYNFPECKHVSNASRSPDGAIRAVCDRTNYLVFTIFNPKEGKVLELAMNCIAAKSLLNVSC
jgi:hypothetical protein